jgi:hypothetical protein
MVEGTDPLSNGLILYRVGRPSIGPDVHIEIKPEVTPGAHPMVDLAALRHAFPQPDRIGAFADRMFIGFVAVALGLMLVMSRFVSAWFMSHGGSSLSLLRSCLSSPLNCARLMKIEQRPTSSPAQRF